MRIWVPIPSAMEKQEWHMHLESCLRNRASQCLWGSFLWALSSLCEEIELVISGAGLEILTNEYQWAHHWVAWLSWFQLTYSDSFPLFVSVTVGTFLKTGRFHPLPNPQCLLSTCYFQVGTLSDFFCCYDKVPWPEQLTGEKFHLSLQFKDTIHQGRAGEWGSWSHDTHDEEAEGGEWSGSG